MEKTLQDARRERDEGIRQSEGHADRKEDSWSTTAFKALLDYARTHEEFTSEQFIADAVPDHVPAPPDPRAFGGVFQRASRAKKIVKMGYTPSKTRHCTPMVVWAAGEGL